MNKNVKIVITIEKTIIKKNRVFTLRANTSVHAYVLLLLNTVHIGMSTSINLVQ